VEVAREGGCDGEAGIQDVPAGEGTGVERHRRWVSPAQERHTLKSREEERVPR